MLFRFCKQGYATKGPKHSQNTKCPNSPADVRQRAYLWWPEIHRVSSCISNPHLKPQCKWLREGSGLESTATLQAEQTWEGTSSIMSYVKRVTQQRTFDVFLSDTDLRESFYTLSIYGFGSPLPSTCTRCRSSSRSICTDLALASARSRRHPLVAC